jgi:hypothetical protein
MAQTEIQISTGKVVLKELNFGDDNEATRQAFIYAAAQGKDMIDIVTKREFLLLQSIAEAPFPRTIDGLRSINRKDGLAIVTAYNALNEVVLGE